MRKLFIFFLITISLIILSSPCFAANNCILYNDINTEEASEIWIRKQLTLISEPHDSNGFCCFDINENGDYVLGFSGVNDRVLVYDANGTYQFGFSLKVNGKFGVKWEGEAIILYLVASDIAIWIDKAGNCLDIKSYHYSPEVDSFLRKNIFANTRNIDGVTYVAKHWLFNSEHLRWGKYPMLVKTTPDGEEIVLFDKTTQSIAKLLTLIILIPSFAFLFVFFSIFCRKHKTSNVLHKSKQKRLE